MKTAYATIKGFKTMRALRKSEADAFNIHGGTLGEKRLAERAFRVSPSALAEASERVNRQLANA